MIDLPATRFAPRRATPRVLGALLVVLALVFSSLAVPALAATAAPTSESLSAYEKQVAAKEVGTAIVNKYLRTVTATLKGGEEVTVRFPAHQSEKTISALKAAGAQVQVLSPSEARKATPKAKHAHHKKRDAIIAAIVVIVIAALIGGFVLVRRRNID